MGLKEHARGGAYKDRVPYPRSPLSAKTWATKTWATGLVHSLDAGLHDIIRGVEGKVEVLVD